MADISLEEIIKIFTSTISFIGSLFIIVTIIKFKDLWTFNFRLIMYLALSNCVISVAFVIPSNDSKVLCQAQGFLDTFGNQSSLLWSACIMRSLYKLIKYEDMGNKQTEIIFNIICWCIPAIASSIPLFTISYEHAQGWCWFRSQYEMILLEFYLPYVIVLLYNCYICFKISKYLRISHEDPQIKALKGLAFRKFIWYPVMLFICYIPVILHRFYSIENEESYIINLLGIIGNTIYGFACAVVYGLTKYVRSRISICCRSSKKQSLVYGNELLS